MQPLARMEPERSTGSTKCPALGPCPASFWARVRGLAGLHLLQLNTDMLCSVDSITTGKGLVSCVCSSVLNGTDIRCMGKVTCAGNCLLQKNVADAQIRCPEKHSGAAQRAVSVAFEWFMTVHEKSLMPFTNSPTWPTF